ncbi:amino acid adenylation domain-containing protein [Tellurirhabdus bombi]|uniref:amino acid adenylation domain-containing protein n=1 Tax=Tellurirhabdus bombi TaxID=2907205 RepID=UPI001F416B65|nr:amino acid adenylation domain-containing protein [Tellurirhabdus bombi]
MPALALDYLGPKQIPYTPLPATCLSLPLFRLFTEQVRKSADKLAIQDDAASYTYSELHQYACQVAQVLGQSADKHQEPIGIWLQNDRKFIAVMLAALAVGRPYVALDISAPFERNLAIMKQAQISDIVSISRFKSELKTLDITVLYLDKLPQPDAASFFQPTAQPDSLAYIIYTSGTTGTPKGVFQNQRNLIHDVSQYIDSIHLSSDDRHSLLYSPTVGGAIRDIFGTLLTGATLYIRDLRKHGLASLASFIKEHQLTIYHSVPSIFRTFLQAAGQQQFPSVRLVYMAGDRITIQDVERYKGHFLPSSFLYIGIGSTENATIYRQWFINHNTRLTGETVPVGYAVPDRNMHLESADGSLTLPGETGEIVVESAYIALGYWQNSQLTQQAFTITKNGRQFRTGDLGRVGSDGLLEYIGRKDRQIKVAGHRIELAAVEATIRQVPLVSDVVVIGRSVASEQVLVAYVVTTGEFEPEAVRKYCLDRLPSYMVPAHWEQIEEIPLLANFKIDVATLQRLDDQHVKTLTIGSERIRTDGPPPTKAHWIKTVVRNAWCAPGAGLQEAYNQNTSWRSGGGSSLEAVAFMIKLEEKLGVQIPAEWIHGDMKPLWLEELLLKQADFVGKSQSAIIRPVIYFFPALIGLGDAIKLVRDLQQIAEIHLITYPDLSKVTAEPESFDLLMHSVMNQISQFPEPDLLLGCCSGSFAAHEVARQLTLQDSLKGRLVLIDFHASLRFGVPLQALAKLSFKEKLRLFMDKGVNKIYKKLARSLFPTWANRYWKTPHNFIQTDTNAYDVFTGSIRQKYLTGQAELFRTTDHSTPMNWEWFCDSVSITELPFTHGEMFSTEENRKMVIKQLAKLFKANTVQPF